MKPSQDEMRLAVARMLPGHIELRPGQWHESVSVGGFAIWWKDGSQTVGKREWLHVAWLAEQSLARPEKEDYAEALRKIVMRDNNRDECYFIGCERSCHIASFWFYCAELLQRLEALCRVRCPEMFTEETKETI